MLLLYRRCEKYKHTDMLIGSQTETHAEKHVNTILHLYTRRHTQTHTLERPYVVWSPDWSIEPVCPSYQFYDIWEWNPRKALRRVTESLIQQLFCKMTLKKFMSWGSRLSPLPYRQIKIKKWIAGTSLAVSSDISVACKPLRWAGTCMDNQPPCYYETCLERINCFD